MLPNLIVIGAARCGTTSLHRYLNLHPEIEMSPRKELEFFNEWNWGQDRRNWDRGLRWYESQFPAEAPVVGESSPTYTDYPVQPHVPERMARVVPEAKLIYLVRDPVERFVSSYRFHRWVLKSEHRPIEEVAHNPATSIHLAASCYAMQLEQYLPHYRLERMLVLEQHALAERRAETLRRVFRFLEVDETFTAAEFERTYNAMEGSRLGLLGRAAIQALDLGLGARRSALVRARAPRALVRPLERRPSVPEVVLPDDLRAALVEALRPDTDRLRAYTGESFAGWST